MISYVYVDGNLSLMLEVDGKYITKTVTSEHLNYQQIIDALSNKTADQNSLILSLLDVKETFYKSSRGRITFEDEVLFEGEPVHGTIVNRIKEHIKRGLPIENILNFLDNLMDNPSKNSVEQLYPFLENENLPITEDGYFLAYKSVCSDFKDYYSKTIDNSIGQVVKMRRNSISDDPSHLCKEGLHAGALSYVSEYGPSDKKIVIVKINPRDVVSVPVDGHVKIRVCEYEVIGLFEGPLPSLPPVPVDKSSLQECTCFEDDEEDDGYWELDTDDDWDGKDWGGVDEEDDLEEDEDEDDLDDEE